MNISAVSSNNPYQTAFQSGVQQRAKDFTALQSALQSGDLSGAQTAFAALQQDNKSSSQTANSSGASGQSSQVKNDFASLQTALQSGNIDSAQQAFATLQSDLQTAGKAHKGGHHHHHHDDDSASNAVQAANTNTENQSTDSQSIGGILSTQA